MYDNNSPEAVVAMYMNQTEGLPFDFRWLAMSTPTHGLCMQRSYTCDYTGARAATHKPPKEKAMKRWFDALRALGRSAGDRLTSPRSLPTGVRSSRRMMLQDGGSTNRPDISYELNTPPTPTGMSPHWPTTA
jgi:hypothetical protein